VLSRWKCEFKFEFKIFRLALGPPTHTNLALKLGL
jgi:hypothetical protein